MRFRLVVVSRRWRSCLCHASPTPRALRADLRGAVHDANGVVPGVEVQMTNEATGIKRSVTTNDVGEYYLRGGRTWDVLGQSRASGLQDG